MDARRRQVEEETETRRKSSAARADLRLRPSHGAAPGATLCPRKSAE